MLERIGGQNQSGGRPTLGLGLLYIGAVGLGDGNKRGVVAQAPGKGFVESGDLLIGDRPRGRKGPVGTVYGLGGDFPLGRRNAQQVPGGLHHHQSVTGHPHRG